jgi:ABC-2 type transport system ATP-binding protein
MIKIQNLSVRYESGLALDNINLEFKAKSISGIIGPNGAGKSSLVKVCTGLINEYSGDVLYGDDNVKTKRSMIKKILSLAPEDPELPPYLTAEEFLKLMAFIRKIEHFENELNHLLYVFDLEPKKNELINSYSHGIRQKISIAAALVGKPKVIILDEAINGLDSISIYRLKKELKSMAQNGHTIIVSSHVLSLIKDWCDEIYILDKGRLLKKYSSSEITELENNNQPFEDVFIQLVENK